MVWTPTCDERIVSESHDRSSVGVSVCREFLHGHLCFGCLEHSSERHEDRRSADCGVEHLDETLLRSHIRILEIIEDLLLQIRAFNVTLERILLLHCANRSLCVMLCSGAVDELT